MRTFFYLLPACLLIAWAACAESDLRPFTCGHAEKTAGDSAMIWEAPLEIDLRALEQAAKSDTVAVELDLGPAGRANGVVEPLRTQSGDDFSLGGKLAGKGSGSLALSVRDGSVAGSITTPDGRLLEVRPEPSGGHVLRELVPQQVSSCATDALPHTGRPAPKRVAESKGDTPAEIDVLILYTPAARDAAGGETAIELEAQLGIDLANQAYLNSEIPLTANVVGILPIDYTESGQLGIDLAVLTLRCDNTLDSVEALRETLGADLVALLVSGGDACGIGWIMDGDPAAGADRGFSVTVRSCISNNTLAHEIGHNLGCAHDRENASTGLFPYSYGWRYTPAGQSLRRTVMAYAPGVRRPFFSNPDVLDDGTPTGVAVGEALQSNNALTIAQTSPFVADWLPSGGIAAEGEGAADGEGEGGECETGASPDGYYCGALNAIYSSPAIRALLDEEQIALLEQLSPATADANGGFDLENLLVFPNGLLDCAYELGVIESILANPEFDASASGGTTYAEVAAAIEANETQLEADIGPSFLPLVQTLVPDAVPLLAAYVALGDENSLSIVLALFSLLESVVANPTPNPADYAGLPQFLSADGNADGDPATNREEYAAYAALGAEVYVDFALDPSIYPGSAIEGEPEGIVEGEGAPEGEGVAEGEGSAEGTGEGLIEGSQEGQEEGLGCPYQTPLPNAFLVGAILEWFYHLDEDGDGLLRADQSFDFSEECVVEIPEEFDGNSDGRYSVGELRQFGEGVSAVHGADTNGDRRISLQELLRLIQFFNSGGLHCAANPGATLDGYAPGPGAQDCIRHSADYDATPWAISLQELLRLIQFFNSRGYRVANVGIVTADGYVSVL